MESTVPLNFAQSSLVLDQDSWNMKYLHQNRKFHKGNYQIIHWLIRNSCSEHAEILMGSLQPNFIFNFNFIKVDLTVFIYFC